MIMGIRVHQVWGDGIEALGRLSVAFLDLWPQLARPATDGVGAQERETAAPIYFPDFQVLFFLEDPNEDRGFLCHLLGVELGQHCLGEGLHMPATDTRDLVGIAGGKRQGSRDRRGRYKRAQGSRPIQLSSPDDRPPEASPQAFPTTQSFTR